MATSQRVETLTIGGVVAVEVIGATNQQLMGLRRKFGAKPIESSSSEPDLTIRFVDRIEPEGRIGLDIVGAAASESGFHLVDEIDGSTTATLPFGQLDGPCEVTYLRDPGSMPMLTDLIRLALLRHGYVAMQAAAFVHEGTGVLVFGWPKSGKTGALLGATLSGASPLGDEWIALSDENDAMFALWPSVTVSDRHYREIRGVVGRRPLRFVATRILERMYRRHMLPQGRLLDLAIPRLVRRLHTTVPSTRLGETPSDPRAQCVIVVERTVGGAAESREITAHEAADRATSVNRFEWRAFLDLYQAWRFANPGLVDSAVEALFDTEERILTSALEDLPAVLFRHRYPAPSREIFAALRRALDPD